MKRRIPTVRGIRAILRKAGVPLSEYKSEVKRGPRYLTVGADVYSLAGRKGMLLRVVAEWCDGRSTSRKLPAEVHVALDAAGYTVDAHGLVGFKVAP